MELISYILRILMPFVGVLTAVMCFISLRGGRREERALVVLEDVENEAEYPVLYWENSIGRSRGSDIRINDPTVSRDHAVLLRRKNGWFVTDTGSLSGVRVNGQKITGRYPVAVGDVITVGTSSLRLMRSDLTGAAGAPPKHEIRALPSFLPVQLLSLYIVMMGFQLYVNSGDYSTALPLVILFGLVWFFYIVSRGILHRRNFELESLALLLSATGIGLTSGHYVRQGYVELAATALGIVLYLFIIWFIEIPDRVTKWHLAISILSLILLASSLVFGKVVNGAKNWIDLGPVTLQPSELAKVCYIFAGASTLDVLQTKKNLTMFILVSGLSVGLLILMSDFGTALIFFMTFLIIAFMRSGDIRTVILAITAAAMGAGVMLTIKPYIADRFRTWGHIWDSPFDEGFQQVNAMIYSASGGVFGTGPANGMLPNRTPAYESDLIFGLVCEETGCIIAVLTAVIIGGFMLYARSTATRSRSTFYSITACSAGGLLVFQAMLNIFGVTDLLPLTGVTLPFVSHGGSSMVACWGLLAFIKASDERTYQRKKRRT